MKKNKKIILSAAILLAIFGIIYANWDKNLPTDFESNRGIDLDYREYYEKCSSELNTIVYDYNKFQMQPPPLGNLQKIAELHLQQNRIFPFNQMPKEIIYLRDSIFSLLLANEMYKNFNFEKKKKEQLARSLIESIYFYYMGVTSNLIDPNDFYSQYAASICVEAMEENNKQLVKMINDPFEVFNNKPIDLGGGIKWTQSGATVNVPQKYKGMTNEDYKALVRLFKLWCWNTYRND